MGKRTETGKSRENGEKGYVLVLVLLLLLLVTLIGLNAMDATTLEIMISGNRRISERAFYTAEAGIGEFMGEFRDDAIRVLSDDDPTGPAWRLFLATTTERAKGIGYDSGNSNHSFFPSIQSDYDYAVEAKHKVDAGNNVVTCGGQPVYVVTGYGHTAEGGNKVVEVELNRMPQYDPKAALYSKSPVHIQGSSTIISGIDHCPTGGISNNVHGIVTTTPTITESGSPTIEGDPPREINSTTNLPLNDIISYLKDAADFTYAYTGNQTLTGYSDSWGKPVSNGTGQPPKHLFPEFLSRVHVLLFKFGY